MHFRLFSQVSTCKADGKIYQNYEKFRSGVDECASCVCIDNKIECDAMKCQTFASVEQADNSFDDYDNSFDDYENIKNQLMEHFFSQYRHDRLRSIANALGCRSTHCPQMLDRSRIDYNVVALDHQELAGRSSNQNRTVFHTTVAKGINNSTLQQEINTVGYSLKVSESSEVTITKTFGISAGIAYIFSLSFTFGRTRQEVRRLSKESVVAVPSQKVQVEPMSKFNSTFQFYQYENIDNYYVDLVIGKDSTITHPDAGIFGSLTYTRRWLIPFLRENIDFLQKMKYKNGRDIKLIEKDGVFVLKNLPTTKKIINFGVDTEFANADPMPK